MKPDAIKIKFEFLHALKNETLTLIPKTTKDELNGEEYVENVYCIEQQKTFNLPPCVTPKILAGYLQSIFPTGRMIVNPENN